MLKSGDKQIEIAGKLYLLLQKDQEMVDQGKYICD